MIAIPNMSKPKECDECPCENDTICQALDDIKGESRGNPVYSALTWLNCPIIEIVQCKECKHRPIKDDPDGADYGFNIVAPTDGDDVCPCLVEDGWYSWMPEDNFYCGRGERRTDGI